jgi:hypothetical protein
MVLSLVITKANHSFAYPVLAVVNRWIRWFVVAGCLAEISLYFGWFDRSFGILYFVYFITWFWMDSVYRWLTIKAISASPLPLFPRFIINRSGDEWPVQRRYLKLREILREKGFSPVQALRSEVATSFYLRVSVYQDSGAMTRLQVSFLPQPMGNISICFHLASRLADGTRLVTDNHYLPFAGFYAETCFVHRMPNRRNFIRLLNYHKKRVALSGRPTVAWTTEPLEDLNAQQSELERINTEMGFLLPHAEHEEHGRISYEGRYRIWKEMLSLNYFGRAADYH